MMRRIKSGSFDGVVERDAYEGRLLERMLMLSQFERALCVALAGVHARFAAGEMNDYWLHRLRQLTADLS